MIADDRAKILDFGLAKIQFNTPEPTESAVTLSSDGLLTLEGRIFGTPAYMSPEQARGSAVDHRSDIHSFGVLLFEMVTGRLPFAGETDGDLCASILRDSAPRPSSIVPKIPSALETVILRCLAKNPGERYQDTEDLVLALQWAQEHARHRVASNARNLLRDWLAGGIITVLACGVVGWVLWLATRIDPPPEAPPPPAYQQITHTGNVSAAALSPDGLRMAVGPANPANLPDTLWLSDVQTGVSRPIFHAAYLSTDKLRWSPDGTRLVIPGAERRQPVVWESHVVPIVAGESWDLGIQRHMLMTWSPDGEKIASARMAQNFLCITDTATRDTTTLPLPPQTGWLSALDWSPNGRWLLYLEHDETMGSRLQVMDIESQRIHLLAEPRGASWPRWSPQGNAVYFLDEFSDYLAFWRHTRQRRQSTTLWRLPLDPANGTATGPPEATLTLVHGRGPIAFSSDGRSMSYISEGGASNLWAVEYNEEGVPQQRQLTAATCLDRDPAISPDQQNVAFARTINENTTDLFVVPYAGGRVQRLTAVDGHAEQPSWSSDSRRLVFLLRSSDELLLASFDLDTKRIRTYEVPLFPFSMVCSGPNATVFFQRASDRALCLFDLDTGITEPLIEGVRPLIFHPRLSPDAAAVAFYWNRPKGRGIWLLPLDEPEKVRCLLRSEFSWPLGWDSRGRDVYALRSIQQTAFIMRSSTSSTQIDTLHQLPFAHTPSGAKRTDQDSYVCVVDQRRNDVWIVRDFDPRN